MSSTDDATEFTNAIESVGVYTPRYRIDAETIADEMGGFDARGVATKSVPARDEDTVTMGVEAAERAIAGAETDSSDVTRLLFATTTPPYEEFDVGATIAEILGLENGVRTEVYTQSATAGTRALRVGIESEGPALVIAADAPRGNPTDSVDHAAGAGAVAFCCAERGTVHCREAATHTAEYPGTRFRRFGSGDVETYDATAYERRAFTAPIVAAVGQLEDPAPTLAITAPDGDLPRRAARAISADVGIDGALSTAVNDFGDLGAASALFGLVKAWADDTDRVTVVGYGDGASVDALVLEGALSATFERETEQIGYGSYLRKRGHLAGGSGGVH